MAIADAYGNPVEPGTPVITLYGSDNKPLPPRKRIIVDSTITLTDDPASNATRMTVPTPVITIPNATESVAGLMSAPDKVKADSVDKVHNAAFTSQTSVNSNTWAVGKYRRLEVRVRTTAGNSTFHGLALVGLVGSIYYNFDLGVSGGAANNTAGAAAWSVNHSTTGGAPTLTKFDIEIVNGFYRNMVAQASGGNGNGQVTSGLAVDNSHDVTGVTVSFSTSSSGWLEVIGYV